MVPTMTQQRTLREVRREAGYYNQAQLSVAADIGVATLALVERYKKVSNRIADKIIVALNAGLEARGKPRVSHEDIDWTIT